MRGSTALVLSARMWHFKLIQAHVFFKAVIHRHLDIETRECHRSAPSFTHVYHGNLWNNMELCKRGQWGYLMWLSGLLMKKVIAMSDLWNHKDHHGTSTEDEKNLLGQCVSLVLMPVVGTLCRGQRCIAYCSVDRRPCFLFLLFLVSRLMKYSTYPVAHY